MVFVQERGICSTHNLPFDNSFATISHPSSTAHTGVYHVCSASPSLHPSRSISTGHRALFIITPSTLHYFGNARFIFHTFCKSASGLIRARRVIPQTHAPFLCPFNLRFLPILGSGFDLWFYFSLDYVHMRNLVRLLRG